MEVSQPSVANPGAGIRLPTAVQLLAACGNPARCLPLRLHEAAWSPRGSSEQLHDRQTTVAAIVNVCALRFETGAASKRRQGLKGEFVTMHWLPPPL